MNRLPRVAAWCVAGLLAGAPIARAADVPKTAPPATSVEVEERHLYPRLKVGGIAAAGGVLLLTGVVLLADSHLRYAVLDAGGDGHSCRPCTASQLVGPRVEFDVGIGVLVIGGALAVASGVLAYRDRKWQRDHVDKLARVTLDIGGVHF